MPIGTASARLKKQVMLHLLQRLGEDLCLRCGQRIERAEDLSLDHRNPWLHVDPGLFWDLNNIAFSHKWCNTTDRNAKTIISPEGYAWCSKCQDHLPADQFARHSDTRSGYAFLCRRHNTEKTQQFRARKRGLVQ
jgi:hypothetical protein